MKILFFRIVLLVLLLGNSSLGICQLQPKSLELVFISDCQDPLKIEMLKLRPYRNREARDSLFADIVRHQPANLFLLGDLAAFGSKPKFWNPVKTLLGTLNRPSTEVHAIPGNHDYLINPRKGKRNFIELFPNDSLLGYCVSADSMAVVMLNSNFGKLNFGEIMEQHRWYKLTMDRLDADQGIKMILVCTHHPPFTNSTIVRPSPAVTTNFLPIFFDSPKAKLFISGHSHNLEYFRKDSNKNFLVIGGGGGLTQPLLSFNKSRDSDLILPENKPLFFYVVAERKGNKLHLYARGMRRDFKGVTSFEITEIE